MKLLTTSLILAVLLISMMLLADFSYAASSSSHTNFSPDEKPRTLTSPNVQSGGEFGWSVSMSGKLVTVGAPFELADGYSEAGHAYVFNATSGALITTLTSPNAKHDGFFGFSVSMSGKLVTVGAPGESADGYDYAGHAYVFNAISGALITNLTSPNAPGWFGYSVFMSGKLVTVGAPYETADGDSGAGHAYIFYNV